MKLWKRGYQYLSRIYTDRDRKSLKPTPQVDHDPEAVYERLEMGSETRRLALLKPMAYQNTVAVP